MPPPGNIKGQERTKEYRKTSYWYKKRPISEELTKEQLEMCHLPSRYDVAKDAEKDLDQSTALSLQLEKVRKPNIVHDEYGNTADQSVSMNPLVAQFRHIKCPKCGRWGHSLGDRACPFDNITLAPRSIKDLEDPLAFLAPKKILPRKRN